MSDFENYESTKGWWFYVQLLIAEQKCQMPESYRLYCEQFAEFLAEANPPVEKKKRKVVFHGTR